MTDTPFKNLKTDIAKGAGAFRSFCASALASLWLALGAHTKKEKARAGASLVLMALALIGIFTLAGVRIAAALNTVPPAAKPAASAASAPARTPAPTGESFAPFTSLALREAHDKNPEVVGWLALAGAEIDDPVVQHADNDFYLRRKWDEAGYDVWGCYFLDYMNSASSRAALDPVTVIYGHALDDYAESEKFSKLKRYKNADFCKANPEISLSLLEEELTFEVFSACDIPISIDYIDPRPSEAKYAATLDYMLANSYYSFGVSVSASDRILVLSTCTSDENVRFIVAARLRG